ncbi:MAG TPA: alanine--tRNA ligase, partial [Acidimicrobiales bacterium]
HLVFFEMLGNFSFGDYFKADAIPWSWELVTERFGFDGDRLWITVHHSDDEAEQIWHDVVGVPMDRIQRLGDKDNFWQMGETGPCGPCSEIHIDRGAHYGPDGGPLHDPHGDRFLEFWNLVFMQFNQAPDGSRTPLPKPSIDTGAGLERILALVQGVESVWETDVMAPLIDLGRSLTGAEYVVGDYDHRSSFSLRVLAEHARSSALLVNDGVFPSNEGRGYVLRRIIRRAVRHAFLLGSEKLVMPDLSRTAIDVMSAAYPDLVKNRDFIIGVLSKEEERFRQTLRTGLSILEDELPGEGGTLSGVTAFKLHDTFGFPLELTEEISGERGVVVDKEAFALEMDEQRRRAKAARRGASEGDDLVDEYRELVEQFGPTDFTGYAETSTEGCRVLAVLSDADGEVEIFLDRTPFYAEAGGQVGDSGTITTSTGTAEVLDCTFALPGLRRHVARIVDGEVAPGHVAVARIDAERRDAIRRNHTGTHLLHWALREVLGEHVKQAGSRVAPDSLRFDFSHYAAVTPDEIARIEVLANSAVLDNSAVQAEEMNKTEAEAKGAIAFFGDKYGDVVRVLTAGPSLELCGGTHVRATGDIGTIKVVSEGSIGSNLRRIEAVTGHVTVALVQRHERELAEAAHLLGTSTDEVLEGLQKRLDELKELRDELKLVRAKAASSQAADLASSAVDGVVVARVDGLSQSDLRELAVAVRQRPGVRAAVLGGLTEAGGVALAAAAQPDSGLAANALLKDAARAVQGGGGGKADIATAGGKDPAGIDDALAIARAAARI